MIHCDWQHAPDDRKDKHGWPVNVCRRCGYERFAPHHPDQWGGDKQLCPAWPRWWELGCKFTVLFGACGIYKGKDGKCGCTKREAWLNSAGARCRTAVTTLSEWLIRRAAAPLPVAEPAAAHPPAAHPIAPPEQS